MTDETLYSLHVRAMRHSAQVRRLRLKRGTWQRYRMFWRLDRAIKQEYRRRVTTPKDNKKPES